MDKELSGRALLIMKRAIMRSMSCIAVGCFLIAADVAALAQSTPPGSLSPKDFDLACAVAIGAEMGASQNEQNIPRRDVAVTIFAFYLGRLSGRDDSKDWNAIAWGAWRSCSKRHVLQKCWIAVCTCTFQKQSERRLLLDKADIKEVPNDICLQGQSGHAALFALLLKENIGMSPSKADINEQVAEFHGPLGGCAIDYSARRQNPNEYGGRLACLTKILKSR